MSAAILDHSTLDSALAAELDAPRWYVAFSGGVDSTVLLHLVHAWCRAHAGAPPLAAIHVHHALHPDADAWQAHCEVVGRALQVPVISLAATVRPGSVGLEAAAREARYQLFETQLQAGEVLFQGHHLDDLVETFFLRLLRGAGVEGLAPMPASRPLGRGRLARPLLPFPRDALARYASCHSLHYVEDSSNRDTRLDRNFLRAQVLPLLASRWPGYRQTVARASGHIGDAAAVLAQALPTPATVHSTLGDPGLAVDALVDSAPAVAAVNLRHWLQRGGYRVPDRALLEEFLRQLRESSAQAGPRLACADFTLRRYRDAVYLLPAAWRGDGDGPALAPGRDCALPGGGRLSLDPVAANGLLLDPAEVLRVRWRRGGERCRTPGRDSGKKLKKLLQEAGIPPWWRQRVPLLYLDDELLAVADLWLCDCSRWRETAAPGQCLWQPRWQREMNTAFD